MMFKFGHKKGIEEDDWYEEKPLNEGRNEPIVVIDWDPREEEFPINVINSSAGYDSPAEKSSVRSVRFSSPKVAVQKPVRAASDSRLTEKKTHSLLCDSDWDRLEHLLAIVEQKTTNPEAQSALFRISGLIATRVKMRSVRGGDSGFPSSSLQQARPLRRRSMFVELNNNHNSLLQVDIEDMYNETYFPSSHRDVSSVNVFDWKSKSGSSLPIDAKTRLDANRIRRLAVRKDYKDELKEIQRTMKIKAVSSHLDSSEMKKWGWHAFDLIGLCDNPMGLTAVKIFSEPGRFNYSTFGVGLENIASFFSLVGLNYNENPYHNVYHAIDALISTRYMVERLEHLNCLSPKECFAALFAAALHDVCHPGVTNALLVNSCDDLAITYNDHSVLENFHVAQAFRMLREYPNFFKGWTVAEKQTFRRIVVQCILGTDMAEHVKHHQFINNEFDVKDPKSNSIALLSSVIHTADISNPAKPQRQMLDMCERVMKEFFEQGDREKKIGLPVSPLCDRDAICIPKAQKGFVQFFIIPWFEAMSNTVCPKTFEIPLMHLRENLIYWEKRFEEVEKTEKKEPLTIGTIKEPSDEVDEDNDP